MIIHMNSAPTLTGLAQRSTSIPIGSLGLATSGAIHLAVSASEGQDWAVAGVSLAVIGVTQLLLALAIPHDRWHLTEVAAWMGLTVALLWIVSITTGLPIGPTPGQPEMVTLPGCLVTVAEIITSGWLFHTLSSMEPQGDAT